MPNIAVMVGSMKMTRSGKLEIGFGVTEPNGKSVGSSVEVDFASSSVQINNAVEAAAKQAMTAVHGVTFVVGDIVKIAGGVV